MGILDQLKHEAAEKQKQQESQTNLQKQREDHYRVAILPAMQKAFKFMQELVEYLNFLEHAIVVDEYSTQYPQFGRLKQQDYKIYTDNHGGFADVDQLMQINVRFFCVGFGAFSYNLEGQNRIEREVAFLSARNIPFDWKLQNGRSAIPSAVFTITRKIPVRFRFEVDYDNSKIHLLINNHDSFTAYKKAFAPEDVNEELLDEIARFMLRKDNDFIRLEISSAQRQSITNLAEQKRREELALLRGMPSETATGESQDKALSARLKALVKLPKK